MSLSKNSKTLSDTTVSSTSTSASLSSSSKNNNIAPPPRSESMAYPRSDTRSLLSSIQFQLRQNTRTVGAFLAALVFLLVLLADDQSPHSQFMRDGTQHSSLRGSAGSAHFAGASKEGYFSVADSTVVQDGRITGYRFGFLTDLDELSRVNPGEAKAKFQSHLVPGVLQLSNKNDKYLYEINFDPPHNTRHLITKHNEAGRGAEFSELTVFDHRLLTADDRTGDVFEILNTATGQDSKCVPRLVLGEGDGDTDKGMKWEWSTVKDGELVLGSMGKEFTDKQGLVVENINNLWIARVDSTGMVHRENWQQQYEVVRKALGAQAPGYMITEAINWSDALQKWVFLPRRISSLAYNDVADEKRGGRKLVLVDDAFTSTQVVDLQLEDTDPLQGFSSFAFVPNSQDKHILAIRSVEEGCADDIGPCLQRSYLVVIDVLTGKQLSPQVKYTEDWKFEGVEFFNPYVRPPAE